MRGSVSLRGLAIRTQRGLVGMNRISTVRRKSPCRRKMEGKDLFLYYITTRNGRLFPRPSRATGSDESLMITIETEQRVSLQTPEEGIKSVKNISSYTNTESSHSSQFNPQRIRHGIILDKLQSVFVQIFFFCYYNLSVCKILTFFSSYFCS